MTKTVSEYMNSLTEWFDRTYAGFPKMDPNDPIITLNEDDE